MELMIVIVIVGILSSVALPQFLGVKGKAELGASIGEAVGLAKECSAAVIIDGPYPGGCADTGATRYTFTSEAADEDSAGVACGRGEVTAADSSVSVEKLELGENESCTITVNDDGAVEFSKA